MFKQVDISDCSVLEAYLKQHANDSNFKELHLKALYTCVNQNTADALQVVLNAKPQTTLSDDIIERASSMGRDAALKVLLPHYDLNTRLGELVLAWAAKAGHLACLKVCDQAITNKDSWYNALTQVCMYGHKECVPFLLNKSDPRALNSRVINLALAYNYEDIAQLLIDSGRVDGQQAYDDAKNGSFSRNLPKLEELMAPVWLRQRLQKRLSEETARNDTVVATGRKM